ncbi:erythromycin esterase [Murinocardiopsis flavida]|uniref:Erythromycin esterase n=1 Tax=Murinocardiopsis flavida TaxID=645275 RepID=A0A2P8D953_9ACTN|nr:erythromycin esterase family protein [Murinocardiopsis flavida]PSK93739.1 erythromycin esterase [Murinocardiopsis flavida]
MTHTRTARSAAAPAGRTPPPGLRWRVPLLALAAAVATAGAAHPVPAEAGTDPVVGALEEHAHPLRSTAPGGPLHDLRPLGRMVGDAPVVALGEATHSSREFFTMKHRAFRHLVRDKGFTTFGQELHVGAGLRFNDYVRTGKGDLRALMRDDPMWNTREYRDLFTWMREYNERHPADKVQFMGNDIDYPSPELFDRVTAYLREHEPALLPEIAGLYAGLRPDTDYTAWTAAYPDRPLAERTERGKRAERALARLERAGAGADPDAFDTAVHYARVVSQTYTMYAFDLADPAELPKVLSHRDKAMADNTVWWHERTGHKMMLSAHNGHVGYEWTGSEFPGSPAKPELQGAFLRDMLGERFVNAGFTFDRGAFNAYPDGGSELTRHAVGPAAPGSNEHVLAAVRHPAYILDTRTLAEPARAWAGEARPTFGIGAAFPGPDGPLATVALRRSYDIVIHLDRVRAARLLP